MWTIFYIFLLLYMQEVLKPEEPENLSAEVDFPAEDIKLVAETVSVLAVHKSAVAVLLTQEAMAATGLKAAGLEPQGLKEIWFKY